MKLRTNLLVSSLVAVALFATACEDSGQATSQTGDGLSIWEQAGLKASAPQALPDSPIGGACVRTDVQGITAVVCDFASGEEATAAVERGLKWVGDHTGASLANGTRLLVVADRDGVDPSGKTINSATRAFLGQRSEAARPTPSAETEQSRDGQGEEQDGEDDSGGSVWSRLTGQK